jgi:radical SAM protein with 4Fe4S-binding SPASM domain
MEARERGIRFHAYGVGDAAGEPSCKENVLRSCFVSAEGEVSPCVMTSPGLMAGPVETLSFGNVRDASLDEIWRSGAARRFREIFRRRIWQGTRGRDGLPGPCRSCLKLQEC